MVGSTGTPGGIGATGATGSVGATGARGNDGNNMLSAGDGIRLSEYSGVVTISADPEARYFGTQISWEQAKREKEALGTDESGVPYTNSSHDTLRYFMTDNRCNAANLFLPAETDIGVESLITFTRTNTDGDGKVSNVKPGIVGPNFAKGATKPLIEIRHGGTPDSSFGLWFPNGGRFTNLTFKINKVA